MLALLVGVALGGRLGWAFVTAAGTATDAGYEVWRFDDALQATDPIFFKLTYGTGNSSGRPRIVLTSVGTATNGAGTLTAQGTAYSAPTLVNGTAVDSTARTSYASSDGSGVAVAFFPASSGSVLRAAFVIDRFRDSSGVAQAGGFTVMYAAQQASCAYQVFTAERDGFSAALAGLPAMISQAAITTTNDGTDTHVAPYWVATPEAQQVKMAACYATADASSIADQSVTHLGAVRTFKVMGGNLTNCDAQSRAGAGIMLWWAD
jgi:hypothetical protein